MAPSNLVDTFPALPQQLRGYDSDALRAQVISWKSSGWATAFSGHEDLLDSLDRHVGRSGGIRRDFVFDQLDHGPTSLFLVAMAWGYGDGNLGPARVTEILNQPQARESIASIVDEVRTNGAAAGWEALLVTNKIHGLNMSFGTKLLYFAGYKVCDAPRPLILDERVRSALQTLAPGTVPPAGGMVRQADYLRYLRLAEHWASDPSWNQEPAVVELSLFAIGGN